MQKLKDQLIRDVETSNETILLLKKKAMRIVESVEYHQGLRDGLLSALRTVDRIEEERKI